MNINAREINTQIRSIARYFGWNVYTTYTDRRTYGKRVKFRFYNDNGNKTKNDVLKAVGDYLAVRNLTKSHRVSWGNNLGYGGRYPFLAMHVSE
jgi:hypothetical protein